ncbi:post-GPI attachment to proteins factor 2-like [Ptychodera flava]|uniref:post-GPI attachment to proteins factor 2-like n=1 Tax=Ptychodera flava TaxID=63121 RepID=UPI003969EDA7
MAGRVIINNAMRPALVQREGLIRVSFWSALMSAVALPLLSFTVCVVSSLLFDFERAVGTHCRVANYLPTVSAAISLSPQSYIWRFCIALHTTLRLFLITVYYDYYKKTGELNSLPWFLWLCKLTFLLQFTEILSLLGLTVVSSSENTSVHEGFFVTFMVTSLCYMLAMSVQYYLSRNKRWKNFTKEERKQQYRLVLLFLVNISTFFISIYFFFRHNWYCEPGIYTLYALFEYIVIITNIAFHTAEAHDVIDKEFVFGGVIVRDVLQHSDFEVTLNHDEDTKKIN